jgi:hypothetical protein
MRQLSHHINAAFNSSGGARQLPMLPSPPALDTAAANSAEVQLPIGARTIGASIPKTSQRAVLSICQLQLARTSFYSASNS